MSYYLADGTVEGDAHGFFPVAVQLSPDSAVESYLGSQYQPKKGGSLPSPRTAPAAEVAPATAAQLVEGKPNPIIDAVSSLFRRLTGVQSDPIEVQRVSTKPPTGMLLGAGAVLLLLYLSRRKR